MGVLSVRLSAPSRLFGFLNIIWKNTHLIKRMLRNGGIILNRRLNFDPVTFDLNLNISFFMKVIISHTYQFNYENYDR